MPRLQEKNKIIIVLGPTASGKSELAVRLARKWNGEIISADSRQVYKGLDIGSNKVPRDPVDNLRTNPRKSKILIENSRSFSNNSRNYVHKGITHHLIDVVSPKRTFTVAQYQKLGRKALLNILRRGKLPIICGGTGFYIDSIIYDIRFPEVKPNTKLRRELQKLSNEELLARLEALDPRRAAEIDPQNKRRLVRAIEIALETGRPVPNQSRNSYSNILKNIGISDNSILKIGIAVPPDKLKMRIEKRLRTRLKKGMIKEVKLLRRQGLSWRRLDDLGLEYRYISRYLRGLLSTKKEMIEAIKKESLRYAKRQMTWWRRDASIRWFHKSAEAEAAVRSFMET